MEGLKPQGTEDEKPASPAERLLQRYFAFMQQVSGEDPVMQCTFWRVRHVDPPTLASFVITTSNMFRSRPRGAADLLAGGKQGTIVCCVHDSGNIKCRGRSPWCD